MRSILTAACALALGIVWSAAPAIAQDTTKEKAENKAERAWDKTKETSKDAWDKTKETSKDAWDKTKATTKDMTGKAKDKMSAHDGRDIRAAQQALQEKGFDPGPADGVMGAKTTAAVKEFQQKNNLTVTGTLDADTRDRLMASSPPSASPGTEPSRTVAPKK
jgi:peptidoglycan hydrolase-like protein with peptidoglycan-binding domain